MNHVITVFKPTSIMIKSMNWETMLKQFNGWMHRRMQECASASSSSLVVLAQALNECNLLWRSNEDAKKAYRYSHPTTRQNSFCSQTMNLLVNIRIHLCRSFCDCCIERHLYRRIFSHLRAISWREALNELQTILEKTWEYHKFSVTRYGRIVNQ